MNESQDECINMEDLEGVIQRDLEKLKAGKKDYQGIGRTYRIRGNGVTSNVRIGDDLKSSRPPHPGAPPMCIFSLIRDFLKEQMNLFIKINIILS